MLNLRAPIALAGVLAGLLLTASASVAQEAVRLSEPVAVTAEHETFGAVLPEGVEATTLSSVMGSPEDHLGTTVVVNTRVDKVCQKKGCFFIAQDGESMVRVSFVDYSFFVPTDIAGKQVTLAGELTPRDLTEAEAAHYREDAGGGSAGMEAGLVYEIVATSVQVPRS